MVGLDDGAGPRAVAYLGKAGGDLRSHESVGHQAVARRLAELFGWPFLGALAADQTREAGCYLVPADTLTMEQAGRLDIGGEADLFGGVVPYAFVASKAITHPLVESDALAPEGWNPAFGDQVRAVVLPGHAVFCAADAKRAGRRLLGRGPLRVKLAIGTGGLGQAVVRTGAQLDQLIDQWEGSGDLAGGAVLEPDLADVQTYSVGQVRLGNLLLSYFGQQQLTCDNEGNLVYGGSRLDVVRGDFTSLQERAPSPEVEQMLEQARVYHAAALSCYPGLFASRCNYDVVRGRSADGTLCGGVLEQSWRLGGASAAEVLAAEAFLREPERRFARAATVEVYGVTPDVPAQAWLYYAGNDGRTGPLCKYAFLEDDGDQG